MVGFTYSLVGKVIQVLQVMQVVQVDAGRAGRVRGFLIDVGAQLLC